jgi:hypothetical protein
LESIFRILQAGSGGEIWQDKSVQNVSAAYGFDTFLDCTLDWPPLSCEKHSAR